MESVQYHGEATIMLPDSREQESMKVGAVLRSRSGVSCASGKLATKLGTHFDQTQVVYPKRRGAKAKVADCCRMLIQEKTRVMHVRVLTPWAPVEVKMALAVLPGLGDILIIGT